MWKVHKLEIDVIRVFRLQPTETLPAAWNHEICMLDACIGVRR